jgi:glycosyltransferase involved in cell wall biosynthesis
MPTSRPMPLVSVYIPTKNRLELLKRAIDSVLSQSYPSIEILVVDDNSTDGTRDYLEKLSETSRVLPVFMPVSVGACIARNLAIKAASGHFVTGLDDDDYFEPDRIQTFVQRWHALNGTNLRIAGLFDGIQVLRTSRRDLTASPQQADHDLLKIHNGVGNQAFAPRDHLIGAGLFDNSMPCWQDWDLWLRMAKKYGQFINCGSSSYVLDLKSTSDRISTQPGFVIRYGLKRFKMKHGPYSLRENARILGALCDYPQVKLSPWELTLLAGSFQLPALARKLAQLVLTPSFYSRLRNRYAGVAARPANSLRS